MIRSTGEVPFRELVESSPAIVYVARADGSIAYVSPPWTTLTGLRCDVLVEQGWPAVLDPDDRGWLTERWRGAIVNGTPFREQFRIRDAAGEPRWVVSQAVPVRDPESGVTAWYGTVYDVVAPGYGIDVEADHPSSAPVANARLYADLAASEARYRSLIETAQEGVWIVDADARTRYVNARLAELLNATPDELYGRSPYEFMDPETAAEARRAFEALRDGATERAERRLIRSDGGVLWVIVSASALYDGQGRFTGALQMITDITDRKAIEMQYRLLAEATPQIVWTADPLGKLTYVNERWTALTGMAREDALGEGWTRMVHRADLARMDSAWQIAREASDDFEAECRLRSIDGEVYRWQLVRGRARRDARGTVIEWLGSMTDVDTTRRLAKTREIVARAGDVLNRSLDRETLLERFAALLVEELGDEATIRVQDEDPVTYGRDDLPPDAPALRAVLRHRESRLGTVLLRRKAPFDAAEAALLDELAARAAIAIENALLYEREHRVAVTLQRALLPAVLPDVAGLTFDAVYYPGATDAEIGGDWYDAIALDDGRVVVSIGDVTGRGLTAAVIMGRMRQAIETLATYETDPVRLLDAADSVLRRAYPDAIVTALVGVIDPTERTLTYATAGHPTPFVRATDGTIRRLPGRGLPLGLRDGHQPPASMLSLPPSALAVFFTDGLIEATRDIDEGERRVVAALADRTIAEGAAPAAAIVARVLDDGVRDDVAVLVVRVGDTPSREEPWTLRWRFDPAEPRRAYDVREAFAESLRAFAPEIDLGAAQLVFGELVGNAVRHAPGTVDVALTWDASAAAVLHVVDDGPGYSPEPTLPTEHAESGRGLYLVQQLTREFAVIKLPGRGAYARAVLLTRPLSG